jgi:3-oxoacyl-[acyl-carrier protein] reductase
LPEQYEDVAGSVAVVTGAGKGIGRAIATTLASHGSFVVVNDINGDEARQVSDEINEQSDREAMAYPADVSDPDSVAEMFESVVDKRGKVDILVNNAGVLHRHNLLEEISEADWDQVLDVNVKGVFNCTKEAIKIMKDQRSGAIVNISSSAGRSTSELGDASYTTSKTAVLGLTRHTAREVAEYDIRANAVCPGLIDTPMVRGSTTSEEIAEELDGIPMGRLGRPEEVAQVVLFLASDASSYISGSTIDVTGAGLLI